MTLVAAVFGGSQGIGRAVASRFIRSGFSVAILSRNNSKREEAITELEKENAYSVGIKGSQCDVTDEKIVQESLKLVEETLGPLRVVVNCAGSIVGMKGNRGQAVYAASKAGLVGLTKSLAQEIGSRGVRVNLVVPGIIQTGMTENMDIEQVKNQVPLSRIGAPEDVAEGVFFLATSPFITGEVLIIDGGLHLNR
ncbi:carbonyl reductase family member 4-like isoform X4 [Limulus polyphemus]|uniref:3-ketoacyl-[acyl-carrier-protein] reductase beta subunit n=1 Tax=Limulus polyphemus TaxID=6850 RepID=A0ABM1TNJ8_LIMPO|nr:carbonyl reductase family member 4-like isoform X4 [Limulus polyphemus]